LPDEPKRTDPGGQSIEKEYRELLDLREQVRKAEAAAEAPWAEP
jgi:hypothetical protein